jgi:hypothetical protein
MYGFDLVIVELQEKKIPMRFSQEATAALGSTLHGKRTIYLQ